MIVWLNGAHGIGTTTTSSIVQTLLPEARLLDAEKIGEVLTDVRPALTPTDNFQHWTPWRPLVVETARHVLRYAGGILVMPMTVLVESYWREISDGLTGHGIPVRHFVLHADQATLRERILTNEDPGPTTFRLACAESYDDAARTWLHDTAEVVDTTAMSAHGAARRIVESVLKH